MILLVSDAPFFGGPPLPVCPPRMTLLLMKKVTGFEKGVLNCDSLEHAEDAPVLRFNLTNSEVRRS